MAGIDDYRYYAAKQDPAAMDPQYRRNPQYNPNQYSSSNQYSSANPIAPRPAPQYNMDYSHLPNDGILQSGSAMGLGAGLLALVTESLLVHPFVVLRRQCQVHTNSMNYHTLPFTLVPIAWRMWGTQGPGALWKGVGSVLVIRGLGLALEDLISKITPWPREVSRHSSVRSIVQHLILKSLSIALVTPFFSASLVETVQSDVTSEKPGIFDVFKEGAFRLVSWSHPLSGNTVTIGRMLPVWILVVPTVAYGVLQYVVSFVVKGVAMVYINNQHIEEQKRQGAISKEPSPLEIQERELLASWTGQIVADSALFPLETILHRMHLQGTRTIVDNLDNGTSVVPILTCFDGMKDCFNSTVAREGAGGLFKGFGAMLLQYAAHYVTLKVLQGIAKGFTTLVSPPVNHPPPQPVPRPNPMEFNKPPASMEFNQPPSGMEYNTAPMEYNTRPSNVDYSTTPTYRRAPRSEPTTPMNAIHLWQQDI